VIVVQNVTKSYGPRKVLEHLSLRVTPDEPLAVLGPSGSGKTTLLRLIAGLETPDEGEIFIDGVHAGGKRQCIPPYQRRIGFVFQTAALWPHMTVGENILFGLNGLTRKQARQRLDQLLAATSLPGMADHYPDQLSGGEARRVALARSLAPEPAHLLMDEPLVNLDPELKAAMLALILDSVRRTGACLIYVTHDEREAEQAPGHIALLKDRQLHPIRAPLESLRWDQAGV
jgi:iron(III) transport system ATP-binding protein